MRWRGSPGYTTAMTFTDNVLTTFVNATDAHREAGTAWYGEANALAREISPADPMMGAGIIACYSIQNPWGRNVRLARETMATGVPAPHTNMVRGKAQRILDGEHPLSVMGGMKTTAFAATIFDLTTDAVVVDRHARDIAFGFSVPKNPGIGKALYNEISDAYREVAAAFNSFPSEVQAITWVSWRAAKGLSWADN